MCGICGILGASPRKAVEDMNRALAHRGPDAEGIWQGEEVLLAHRRLAIIDTAPSSDQPFIDSEDLVMVFNGEIYNYRELKARLAHHEFRTNSDTEVLLAAYKEWGHAMLSELNGMFAFAIWDGHKKELFIARDRLGIKPLYYYIGDEQFVFASEVRAMLASGFVPRKLDQNALVDHLRYQSVHAPNTLVQDVMVLMPGHYMVVEDGHVSHKGYWELNAPKPQLVPERKEELHQAVRARFTKAVERRLVADVPFGAFLSGGIDSSMVVGTMSDISDLPVKTFNIAFNEAEFSEAKFARTIADRFKTEHNEILLKPDDMLDVLPTALKAMDHPSGDGPNTFIVSKATKQAGVSMALSGLGGDELFAGYDIFTRTLDLESKKWLPSFPKVFRKLGAAGLLRYKRSMASLKIGELLRQNSFHLEDTYPISRLTFLDRELDRLLKRDKLPANLVRQLVFDQLGPESAGAQLPLLSKVSVAEMSTYMQNTLLRDSDQMSMAHALEVRVPFLDHELVEFLLQVSDVQKFPTTPKQLLLDSMSGMLPKEVWDRPKMGFTLPWADWMRGELRSFCEARINALADRSPFNGKEVLDYWQRFLQKDPIMPWSRIWHLVVLEDWLDQNDIAV